MHYSYLYVTHVLIHKIRVTQNYYIISISIYITEIKLFKYDS